MPKHAKCLPAQDVLADWFLYEPETGKLFWRARPLERFSGEVAYRLWNGRFAGKEAGTLDPTNGYLRTAIAGQKMYVHRVIWKLEFGTEPDIIDHASGVKINNRLDNLCSVGTDGNLKNRCMDRRNTSGVMGVFWDRKRSLWRAEIGGVGFIGRFASLDDAASARRQAEGLLGYHPNHGRPAA